LGSLVGLGSAAHHYGRASLCLSRHPGAAEIRGRSGPPRHLVGGSNDHRLRRRPHRLLLGALVELAAPVAVQSGYGLAAVLAAAPDERLRNPLSDDGIDHVARPGRFDAAQVRAGAAARIRRNDMSGMIPGGWNFVVAAYSVTAIVLTIYGASVILRLRAEIRRNDD